MTSVAKITLTEAEIAKFAPHADWIRGHIRTAANSIIIAGKHLADVKAGLGHGKFLAWIDRELNMTDRTARNYMQVAAWAEGKSETVSDLPPSTLYLLASPSTPPEVTDEVISDLEAGKPVAPREIEAKVKAARKPKPTPPPSDAPAAEPEPEKPRSSPGQIAFAEFNKALVTSRSLWSNAGALDLAEIDDKHRRLILEILDTAEQEIAETFGRIRAKLGDAPDPTPPTSDDGPEGTDLPAETPAEPEIDTAAYAMSTDAPDDDPLAIPAQFRRAPSKKKPAARKVSEEARAKREAHKTAVECRKLLDKAKAKKARERRAAAKAKKPADWRQGVASDLGFALKS